MCSDETLGKRYVSWRIVWLSVSRGRHQWIELETEPISEVRKDKNDLCAGKRLSK